MKMIFFYLAVMNICTFFLYGADKRRAVLHRWRIPERVLIGAALIGGSFGALLGMRFFRHKTRHPKFFIGVPLAIIIQAAFFVLVATGRL